MGRAARPTVYTVADRAQVSVATVSRALAAPEKVSEATRLRVLEAIDALGYVPHGAARSLAADAHRAHGLVLPELVGPYYSDLLLGYEREAATGGDAVVLALAGGDDLAAKVLRIAGSVDGIVVMGASALPRAALAAIRELVPVLGLTGGAGQGLEVIGTRNLDSSRELTQHLVEHGRNRLVFVGDPDLAEDIQARYRGFCEALQPHAPEPVRVEPSEAAGVEVAERLLAGELDADGLVCANDELALGVIVTLTARGCDVPGDVAVVGWDDVMAARYVQPSLTTVRQPVADLGATAARRLREHIAAFRAGQLPPGPAPDRLTTSVIYRRSCGCTSDPSKEQEHR
jgi:LacI family transcriptional regulator